MLQKEGFSKEDSNLNAKQFIQSIVKGDKENIQDRNSERLTKYKNEVKGGNISPLLPSWSSSYKISIYPHHFCIFDDFSKNKSSSSDVKSSSHRLSDLPAPHPQCLPSISFKISKSMTTLEDVAILTAKRILQKSLSEASSDNSNSTSQAANPSDSSVLDLINRMVWSIVYILKPIDEQSPMTDRTVSSAVFSLIPSPIVLDWISNRDKLVYSLVSSSPLSGLEDYLSVSLVVEFVSTNETDSAIEAIDKIPIVINPTKPLAVMHQNSSAILEYSKSHTTCPPLTEIVAMTSNATVPVRLVDAATGCILLHTALHADTTIAMLMNYGQDFLVKILERLSSSELERSKWKQQISSAKLKEQSECYLRLLSDKGVCVHLVMDPEEDAEKFLDPRLKLSSFACLARNRFLFSSLRKEQNDCTHTQTCCPTFYLRRWPPGSLCSVRLRLFSPSALLFRDSSVLVGRRPLFKGIQLPEGTDTTRLWVDIGKVVLPSPAEEENSILKLILNCEEDTASGCSSSLLFRHWTQFLFAQAHSSLVKTSLLMSVVCQVQELCSLFASRKAKGEDSSMTIFREVFGAQKSHLDSRPGSLHTSFESLEKERAEFLCRRFVVPLEDEDDQTSSPSSSSSSSSTPVLIPSGTSSPSCSDSSKKPVTSEDPLRLSAFQSQLIKDSLYFSRRGSFSALSLGNSSTFNKLNEEWANFGLINNWREIRIRREVLTQTVAEPLNGRIAEDDEVTTMIKGDISQASLMTRLVDEVASEYFKVPDKETIAQVENVIKMQKSRIEEKKQKKLNEEGKNCESSLNGKGDDETITRKQRPVDVLNEWIFPSETGKQEEHITENDIRWVVGFDRTIYKKCNNEYKMNVSESNNEVGCEETQEKGKSRAKEILKGDSIVGECCSDEDSIELLSYLPSDDPVNVLSLPPPTAINPFSDSHSHFSDDNDKDKDNNPFAISLQIVPKNAPKATPENVLFCIRFVDAATGRGSTLHELSLPLSTTGEEFIQTVLSILLKKDIPKEKRASDSEYAKSLRWLKKYQDGRTKWVDSLEKLVLPEDLSEEGRLQGESGSSVRDSKSSQGEREAVDEWCSPCVVEFVDTDLLEDAMSSPVWAANCLNERKGNESDTDDTSSFDKESADDSSLDEQDESLSNPYFRPFLMEMTNCSFCIESVYGDIGLDCDVEENAVDQQENAPQQQQETSEITEGIDESNSRKSNSKDGIIEEGDKISTGQNSSSQLFSAEKESNYLSKKKKDVTRLEYWLEVDKMRRKNNCSNNSSFSVQKQMQFFSEIQKSSVNSISSNISIADILKSSGRIIHISAV
eukprot:MONOS_9643.1-p1 / transcript=MONOS_9643.1 / gene=MONOS_9643 / organism=Monocercomonoides_exilis_PA203 / gene_product=unspecified product / transcript_product=unspecified product / location=Mono_scaffold00405:28090-32034(+) / protein_length=1315 / sequence_SO=supercontig / SO=protein_coding / is_pseudo=false